MKITVSPFYVLCVFIYENDFPTRRWNTVREASECLRLIARARKWRVRVSIVFGSGGLRVRYNNTIPSRQTLESDPLDDWTQPVAVRAVVHCHWHVAAASPECFCGSHKDIILR